MKPAAALAFLSALVSPAIAADAPAEGPKVTDFIRVDEDDSAARLQTSVTRFKKDGASVELVGAIHIADKDYYTDLNKRFDGYDALLFEMIGGENKGALAKPDAAEEGDDAQNLDALHQIYGMVSRLLALSDQMSQIDYSKEHFVHADLSLKEFQELQNERGESLLGFALDAAKQAEAEGAAKQPDLTKLLTAMMSGNSNAVKLEIVHTLGAGDDQIAAFAGESVIIGDRNAKCLKVLGEQVTAGKKKLGIFYGAAHFPDMEQRLLEAGWKRAKQDWITAWDIPKPKPVEEPAEEKKAA